MGKWKPVGDSEVTRGLAAMIVFNGLSDYADCRLCRLVPDDAANAADEGVSVPSEAILTTIQGVLLQARKERQSILRSFGNLLSSQNAVDRVDAALAWLGTLKGGE